jgi:hypothetical protein
VSHAANIKMGVDRATSKGIAMGQIPLGLYTIAHTSTTPTVIIKDAL